MEGGAISDAQLSASSVYYGFLGLQRWGPELARLNNHGIVNAWTSSNYDKSPWIQVSGAGLGVPAQRAAPAATAGLAVLLSQDFTVPGGKCGAKLLQQAATQGHLGMCLEEASPLEEGGTRVYDPPCSAHHGMQGWKDGGLPPHGSSSALGIPFPYPSAHPLTQAWWC